MSTTVNDLQQVPFADRTLENKIEVVSRGKPRPWLNISAATIDVDGNEKIEHFDTTVYDKVPWLTGCERSQCLLCWPCLLFGPDGLWNHQVGISDFELMKDSIATHEKTCQHIQATLSLEMFSMEHFRTKNAQLDDLASYDLIQKNRQMIKILIDVLCFVVIRAGPPRKKTNCPSRIKPENCVKIVDLFHTYGNNTKDAIKLIESSPGVLNDLVDSISKVLSLEVKKETQLSSYVSIILSEHFSRYQKSQISTVLRFIKNGKVCERFLGFTNIKNKSSVEILNHITTLIEEFELSDRFLAYSFDGALLHQSALKQVVEVLKENYPFSYFVPSYFHTLHYIFQQTLSEHKECGTFLKTLKAMEIYFQKNSRQWTVVRNNAQLRKSKWCDKSEFIKVVNSYRKYFIDFFNTVVKNCNKWSADDITIARGLQPFLEEFDTVFLLKVYSRLIELTQTFDEFLKSPTSEKTFAVKLVFDTLKTLGQEREQGFEKLWDSVIEENTIFDAEKPKKLKVDYGVKEEYCRELFNTIIDHIINEIIFRFNAVYLLEFSCMIENRVKEDSELKPLPSDFHLSKLMEVQGPFYDEEHLKNEFIVLRMNDSVFSNKSVYDLLNFFTDSNLSGTFKYLNKLVEFILTMPFKLPSSNGDFSKFQKISNFAHSTSAPGDISFLHVESDFLQYAMRKVSFYDEVMTRFSEVNKSVELMLQTDTRIIL